MTPTRAFDTVVLTATAVWHLLAAWHFILWPARTLARTTDERPVNALAVELFRFLGGLNLALVVLALASVPALGAFAEPAFIALAVANLSQFIVDVRVRRLKLARGAFFTQILVGDGLFAALNAFAALRGYLS